MPEQSIGAAQSRPQYVSHEGLSCPGAGCRSQCSSGRSLPACLEAFCWDVSSGSGTEKLIFESSWCSEAEDPAPRGATPAPRRVAPGLVLSSDLNQLIVIFELIFTLEGRLTGKSKTYTTARRCANMDAQMHSHRDVATAVSNQ